MEDHIRKECVCVYTHTHTHIYNLTLLLKLTHHCKLTILQKKKKRFKKDIGSSHCGSAVTNLTSIY